MSISAIACLMGVPPAAFAELWLALWKWIVFFGAYREHVADDAAMSAGFLLFTGAFGGSKEALAVLSSTRGVRRMITRIWVVLLRTTDTLAITLGFENAQEVVDGAGDSLEDLAFLVVGYIDGIRPNRGVKELSQDSRLYGIIVEFVVAVDTFLAPGGWDRKKLKSPAFPPLLPKTIWLLGEYLPIAPGSSFVADAVKAGLLRVIVSCGDRKFDAELIPILDAVLSKSLISYYAVSVFKDALQAVQSVVAGRPFRSSKLQAAWQRFSSLVEERIGILRSFDAAGGRQKPLGVRDRHFMRALLTHDYNAQKSRVIYPAQAFFMARHPNVRFLTLFNYSQQGPVRIAVLNVADHLWSAYFGTDSQWHNDLARVVRARGRFGIKCFIVPLRAETSDVQDMLKCIVRGISPDTPLLRVIEEIRRAMPPTDVDGSAVH
ncbi:hypothetical protein DFH09DRAFT_1373935 [Mycena vulgaris]|nr:hypothetical protein DFH09DRAFT_1373935 [Mycena vulgaris]